MSPQEAVRLEKAPESVPFAIPVPKWQFSLAIFRAVLGGLCCLLAFAASSNMARNSGFLWIGFTFYAGAAVLGYGLERRGYMLLSLLIDTVFFLICSALPFEYATGITALFYLYILMSAALLHTAREIFVVVIGTTAFFFLAKPAEVLVFSPAVLLSGTAVTVMALQRQSLQERLRAAARQAMMFRSEADHAKEAERQRIAHDFHDGPLQCFVGFSMRLEVAKKWLERDPKRAMAELEDLQLLVKSQSEEIRQFVRAMRPPEIDGSGLVPTLKKLVEGFEKDSGIAAVFVGSATRVQTSAATATEISLICREALHNVQKHAQARHVTVGVGRDGDVFELSVEDDGKGFAFSGAYALEELDLLRLGPASIRSRVRQLNGEMLLDSRQGSGATLKIRIPL